MCNCNNKATGSILMPTMKQALHGASTIIQSQLGIITRADPILVAERKDICFHCDKLNRGVLVNKIAVNQCSVCKCVIEWKTEILQEHCPVSSSLSGSTKW
jgi:hypothetical protein